MVKDAQVRLMRRKMKAKKMTIAAAAAAAGMSERSGRKWKQGPLPSQKKTARTWRTRPDAFASVWSSVIVPLLVADEDRVLEARTILGELERRHPGAFNEAQVRTLQRRMRDWRAVHGPEREVFFEQVHVPGREAALDFTHATELGVTILGTLLEHLLFVFTLSFSGWTWIAIAFGETFEALVSGLQGALYDLGGVPAVARHDNLSAATHELQRSGGRALTVRWRAVLDHYGLRSTRIAPGESNENGVAEKSNYDVKKAIAQALVLRGSKDFTSIEEYLGFARDVVERTCNRPAAPKLALEREKLRPLPSAPVPSYTTFHPTVRCWSTIRVGKRIYSVPSRLIGHEVEVRQHPNVVEVLYRDKLVEVMPRLRGNDEHRIDYRHVIWSLVRKPGAFARYRYREDLFPSLTFRRAYDALCACKHDRADVEYVRILHLAASTIEVDVERALATLLERGVPFDYAAVKAITSPHPTRVPEVSIGTADLRPYDALLGGGAS
jgi:hypothetical protein